MRDFYSDERRAGSAEVDFGGSWRTQGEGSWRVVWLEATGELAAFHAGASTSAPTGRLGVQAILGGATADEVVVLAVEPDRARLREVLAGWEMHMGDENGLAWLAERCDALADER